MARGQDEKNATRTHDTRTQDSNRQDAKQEMKEPNRQEGGRPETSRQDEQGTQAVAVRQGQGESGREGNRRGEMATRGWEPLTRWGGDSLDLFDRLFDQFSRQWLGIPTERTPRAWGLAIKDEERHVIVRAEAPGFDPKDFDIQLRGDQLILRAEHSSEDEGKGEDRHSWSRQQFFRSLTLPEAVDHDKVKAAYRNGVLTITMQKKEESKGRRINVE